MVSKAFQVLSDPQKRRIYDQTGGDPESRMPSGTPSSSGGAHPFAGFQGHGNGMFGDDISPEDLFNMFFGNGGMGGMGMGGGTTFSFGGPGIRVHQFGGNPGMRARRPAAATPAPPLDPKKIFWQLLPLIFLFLLPMLSGLWGGEETPRFSMSYKPPFTEGRQTQRYDIPYYADPKVVKGMGKEEMARWDKSVETRIIADWNHGCRLERSEQERRIQDAIGIIYTDHERLRRAKSMPLPSCVKLKEAEVRRRNLLETRNAPK